MRVLLLFCLQCSLVLAAKTSHKKSVGRNPPADTSRRHPEGSRQWDSHRVREAAEEERDSSATRFVEKLHRENVKAGTYPVVEAEGEGEAAVPQRGYTPAEATARAQPLIQNTFQAPGGFNPLRLLLGGAQQYHQTSPFFVPVPIVLPPPPPPPPGPKCYTNPSGFLCCNVTLERAMETAYAEAKAEGVSDCNAQKITNAAAEKKFGTAFETITAHKDFVARVNFAGDLNCKVELDGKYILAYATPLPEPEVKIVDANSFFAGEGLDEYLEGKKGNETEEHKPTYIVYGPVVQ